MPLLAKFYVSVSLRLQNIDLGRSAIPRVRHSRGALVAALIKLRLGLW